MTLPMTFKVEYVKWVGTPTFDAGKRNSGSFYVQVWSWAMKSEGHLKHKHLVFIPMTRTLIKLRLLVYDGTYRGCRAHTGSVACLGIACLGSSVLKFSTSNYFFSSLETQTVRSPYKSPKTMTIITPSCLHWQGLFCLIFISTSFLNSLRKVSNF